MGRIEQWLAGPTITKLLAWITVFLVALTLVLAVLTIPGIASDTSANRRTDDLNGCRASYRSDIDNATASVFDTYGDVQDTIGYAVIAAIRQDPTQLAIIAADITTAIEARQGAIEEFLVAAARYEEAVNLSQTDPDLFLTNCKELP